MSEKNPGPKPSPRYALPFFAALAVLTAVSFCIPLRPTVSYNEKRELTKFPAFSVEALVSGDYFDEITLWFSDTFPGREGWISLSDALVSLHGYSEIAIEGPLTGSDQVPPAQTAVPAATRPTQAPAREEVPATETLPVETAVPETTQPGWGGVDLEAAGQEIALGPVIQIGDAAYNQQGFAQKCSDSYIASVSGFADRMAEHGIQVISAPAPTAIGVMVEGEDLEQLGCARQDDIIAYLHDSMGENVTKVNALPNLVAHNDEYIYFRTDHHWTALGAYYAYESLCQALGYEAAPLDSFQEWDQGLFVGSIFGKARWPAKLTKDNLMAYVPPGEITMTAYRTSASTGSPWPLLTDKTREDPAAKYSTFLGADCALAHVVNESIPDAPSCIVVKDSFGNCYVPFLTQNYHEIFAVDYRKYNAMSLEALALAKEVDQVIFAPYLTATQSVDGAAYFENKCR